MIFIGSGSESDFSIIIPDPDLATELTQKKYFKPKLQCEKVGCSKIY